MSGPGGRITKRDQRRETRREQFQRTQAERKRELQRQQRAKQIRQWGFIGGALLILALIGVLIAVAALSPKPAPSAANGDTIDGIQCQANEQIAFHIHSYVKIYVNGAQVTVPEGTGITSSCLYWIHVHQTEPNIIHMEAPQGKGPFTVSNLFHIWGQHIGNGKFMDDPVDDTHKVVTQVYDVNGKLIKTVDGDPSKVEFADQQTVVILYNSPNVKPVPYDWSQFHG